MALTGNETVQLHGRFSRTETSTQAIADLATGTNGGGNGLTAISVTTNSQFGGKPIPPNGYLLYAL